ncbi:MAG: heme lyase CcmF/NrfE family subunit [Chloroflexi bacterium]|nr:heme lyase CcmF/NrfE family subunit [Chloroflexota bacterium]
MADLGTMALIIAALLCCYAIAGSVLGARAGLPRLIDSARRAVYLNALVLAVATASLVSAFLAKDFSIQYVAEHSNRAMEPVYVWVAFYAGNEGSILFIALALSCLSALAVWKAPKEATILMPYASAIMMVVLFFFITVMLFLANPFATLAQAPPDGRGINPLLAHPGMFFHPPSLMTGLVAVTIPFAVVTGALLAGQTRDQWVDMGRTWGLIAWAILGVGNLLGSWWAYTILGWGGYWGWDPVENAGFMPWLALTAFVHSVMVQKRRGIFRLWNVVLVSAAFFLASFGMFINRGGPVPSVHSFGASTVGWVFLAFLAVAAFSSIAVIAWRYNKISSAQPLDSPLSREAAFLLNNLLLLAIALVTMWGVVFPLISELARGVTVTVARPFYDQINGPIFLALIFLMGVGPLLPWRSASPSDLRRSLLLPSLLALGVVALLALMGVSNWYALASFGLCVLVVSCVVREWVRGTLARSKQGHNLVASFVHLLGSNRPRYGGYIVHLAVVLLALGVTGSSFYSVQKDVVLAQGQREGVGKYEIEYVSSRVEHKPDREEWTANLMVYRGDRPLGAIQAGRTFYPEFRMSSTRAGIRSTPVEDLYVIPSEFLDDGRASFRILVNPLVMWIWVAGPVLIVGALVALWPDKGGVALSGRRRPEAAPAVGSAYSHEL